MRLKLPTYSALFPNPPNYAEVVTTNLSSTGVSQAKPESRNTDSDSRPDPAPSYETILQYSAPASQMIIPPCRSTSLLLPPPDILSGSRLFTTHTCSVRTKENDMKWLKLCINSSAESSNQIPCLWQGDPITGSVELDLGKETTIRSVKVSVSYSNH